jgi:hypothetical protein
MKPKKILWTVSLVVVVLLLIGLARIGSFWFYIRTSAKRSIIEADSGFRRATNTINPEDLRAWALEMVRKEATEKQLSESMPGYIRNLYAGPPPFAFVSGSCVCLMWGGGFFHWGFFIGSTNETMPFVSANREYPYNFEWRPGIYYTREADWKLQ